MKSYKCTTKNKLDTSKQEWLKMDYKVSIEIVNILESGKCPSGHKVGETFQMPEDRGKICSAAFHAIYPYLTGLQFGASFPWEEDPDNITICCPDYKNPVVFKITRQKSE
ncbi:MAG: TIGR04076 family protein [Candidatus Odinarchaeota archaeon]